MERDNGIRLLSSVAIYFNSQAHVERDQGRERRIIMTKISTHTLTWSVTGLDKALKETNKISTHTLTWSVTSWRTLFDVTANISTHTLTWSVTR